MPAGAPDQVRGRLCDEPVPRTTACTRDACGSWVSDISLIAKFRDDTRNQSECEQVAIHHECGVPARHLSPRARPMPTVSASLPATGRGWRHPSFMWQRPAPGRRADGSRSRRPAVTVAVEVPAMARSAATAEEAHGRKAADLQRDTNRRHAGAARQPGDPPRVSGSPTGFPGRPARGLPGPDPAPGCR